MAEQHTSKTKTVLKWLAMFGVLWVIFGTIIFLLAIKYHQTYYSLEVAAFCGFVFAADITAIALVYNTLW
ncbi:MAG: hypothetical protein Q6362_011720 [Candidatus Wukongarchaeota archaeon]|nr:hypothetical protein [Candidatus Wukongarchaeota archaeon]MDO8130078.1 hypothetical protein [Candidatus Wukongarchaeota archaeon]